MDSIEGNYKLLKSNPEELILFVDKHVRVQLIKNSSFIGFVHSIDPISSSIILSVPQVDSYKTVLLPGNAILDISEIEPISIADPPTRKSIKSPSAEDLTVKKGQLMAWLKLNLMPAVEDGDNIVFGNASLLPPYTPADICTDNPMVAMQMRKILETFSPNS